MRCVSVLAVAALASVSSAQTVNASYNAPTFDRWNYPFNFTPGERQVATSFSSGFIPNQFDDRDAQFLNSFITAGDVAPGMGAANYEILSATFTATLAFGVFDYTDTYNPGGQFSGGTSIDLLGTGFRAGLNAFAYGDDFAWGAGAPTDEDVRFAYATDFAGGGARDVSNQIRDGLTVTPFAVGSIAGETSGTQVTAAGQLVTFEIDLGNPDAVAYLQDSLNSGILSLTVSSLHEAEQMGSDGFPGFATNENGTLAAPTLDLSVRIVPAPASAAMLGLGALVATRRRR